MVVLRQRYPIPLRYIFKEKFYGLDPKKQGSWQDAVGDKGLEKPSASENKERIIRWMSFWPWSLTWTLINEPIKKAFRAIYRRIQKLLQSIADKAFKGTEADFK